MENEVIKLKGDKKLPTVYMLKRIMKYIWPELPRFIISLLLILFNVIVDVSLPLLITKIVNNLQLPPEKIKLFNIIFIASLFLAISIINQIVLYIESIILQKAGQSIIYNLRLEVFTHIENMSQNQFDEMPVGALVTRVASYTSSISDLFTNVLVSLIRNILTVFSVYGVMLFISFRLALFLLIFVVIIFVTSFLFAKIIGKIFRNESKQVSNLNTYLNENLSGMKLIQIFNQEKTKEEEFLEYNNKLKNAIYKVVIAFGIYRPFVTFIYIITNALTFYFGIKFGLDADEIVAFYLYLSKFFNPIQNISEQFNNLQKALTSCERLFNLLDVKPEVRDREDAIDIDHFDGKIEFKNVWFSYKKDQWILKDVSFIVNKGETAAFVGATGAGKTTILALIVRNYEIQKGQILIDDIDITKIKIKSLRKAIGQMLQDVFLFSGTIRSNITLNDESISDEQVLEAARYVNANTIIDKMPQGLDEPIIESGANLSQGQRQLLSFARTVLHKPQILILDEATANIDTETESLIQQSLLNMKNIGTMLIVAHRLSTVQHSDQIICLSHGEVVERGTHQELLNKKGYYYKLYELQFKDR